MAQHSLYHYPVESREMDHSVDTYASLRLAESYNSWHYAEDASLYSIAEDSREDGRSEAYSSRAGTEASNAQVILQTDQYASLLPSVRGKLTNDVTSGDVGVEARWIAMRKDEEVASTPAEEEDGIWEQEEKRKRLIPLYVLIPCLCFTVAVLGMIIAVALVRRDDDTSRSDITGLEGVVTTSGSGVGFTLPADTDEPTTAPTTVVLTDANVGSAEELLTTPAPTPTPVPTPVPTSAPTSKPTSKPTGVPTAPPTIEIPSGIVSPEAKGIYTALARCPYSDSHEVLDWGLPEGEAFAMLVYEQELKGKRGRVDVQDVLDRWALYVLFFATAGEFWFDDDDWFDLAHVCDWDVDNIKCNDAGDAVTEIDLSANNLSGDLPQQLCCMSELTTLKLASNNLSGDAPPCLSLLVDNLDLSGNAAIQLNGSP